MSDSEIIRYMFVSKATRRMREILEILRQTGAGWPVILLLAGLIVCFFGHRFKRVLPFFIGLAAGFAMSCILKDILAGGGRITLDKLSNGITLFVNRVKELGFGYIRSIFEISSNKTVIILIICSLACACIGALLYKLTIPVCLGVLIYSFARIILYESEHVQLYSILISASSFAVLALFYNQLFILSTAAAGATCVGFVTASTDLVALTVTYIIAIVLFAAGAAFQFIQFYRRRKRAIEKKKTKVGKTNKAVA